MTPLDAALWGGVLLLGGAAAWWTIPRPVALDWELHWKVTLSTLLRGRVEAADGKLEDWLALGAPLLWFHAGGRELEQKLAAPDAYEIPVPARPGERALVEALVKADDPIAALWEASDPCLYDDPAALGPEFAPSRALGPQVDWEHIAAWKPEVGEALRRRHEHTRVAVLGRPGLAAAVCEVLGDEKAVAVEGDLEEGLGALAPGLADRLIVFVAGEAIGPLLDLLADAPALRDRLRAVVGLGVSLGDRQAWLAVHWTHERFDTEISRATPWFHLAWVVDGVEPIGEPGTPLAETRFPEVPVPPTGRVALEPIDLGVLRGASSATDDELLARALLLTLTARLEG